MRGAFVSDMICLMPKRRAVTPQGKRVAESIRGLIKEYGSNARDMASRLSTYTESSVDYHAFSRRLNGTNPMEIGEIIDICELLKQIDATRPDPFEQVFLRAGQLKR